VDQSHITFHTGNR